MPRKTSKKELIRKAKGMRDILPESYLLRKKFVEKAETIASFYGFEPIQTPHLERLELFSATVGETTDIVEKEMYNLKTKGGDKLVLRPEGTAPVVRAYLEHGMHTRPQPVMFYYTGSFFRHERPQRGRNREYDQFGLEILGEEDSIADAIIIKVLSAIIEEAGNLKSVSVRLNSVGCEECRPRYQKDLVAYYRRKTKSLCESCQRRLKSNPLRLLDCKEEQCADAKKEAPQMINYLCQECTVHLKDLLETLDAAGVPYYLDHYLVRGLDYYTKTVFELFAEGEPLALAGGGRYDGMAEILGGKKVAAAGGAIGIDRIMEIMPEAKKTPAEKPPKVFLIQLGSKPKHKSLAIIEELRKAKIPTGHSLNKDSLKGQLKMASKLMASYALILGQKEYLENTIIIRNLESASQEVIPLNDLINYLKKKI